MFFVQKCEKNSCCEEKSTPAPHNQNTMGCPLRYLKYSNIIDCESLVQFLTLKSIYSNYNNVFYPSFSHVLATKRM